MDLHKRSKIECITIEHYLLWDILQHLEHIVAQDRCNVPQETVKPLEVYTGLLESLDRVSELYPMAKELKISKYSTMSNEALIAAIRKASDK